MRLNGWQRLWVVIAALWTPIGVWQLTTVLSRPSVATTVLGIAAWATPSALLYLVGVTVAWVRRGFTEQTP